MWTLALAALLLAGAGAPPSPAAAPEREWGEPPPAAAADQQLWRDLKEGTASATVHLARLARCAYRIRYGRYYEALDERKDDARARDARALLAAAAKRAQAAVPTRPGVYACRHVLLDLDQRISGPQEFRDVGAVRSEARGCVARMSKLVAAVEPAAEGLEAALARVDEELGRARPALPASAKAGAPDEAHVELEGAAR
jgi:hypothetical protein